MGRAPCCDKTKVKTGPWSPSEDLRLINFIHNHGHTNWRALPNLAGLLRCGKSCRLRWINYLRPDVKRGNFTPEEENTIIQLHNSFGNKWSKIASRLPGRTDNEIKNVWNTHLKKRAINWHKTDDELGKHSKIVVDMNSASSSSSSTSSSITTTGDDKADTLRPASSHNSTLSDEVATDHEIGDLDDQFDDEFWEMLESLDPVQSNITVEDQINVEEKSDVDFGKWLRFMENELGLNSTDVDLRLDSDPQITSPFHHSLAS